MVWIDVTEEMVTEDVMVSPEAPVLVYSHKFGPVLALVGGRKVTALTGLKCGNYKAELEYVEGSEDITVRVFMRDPAMLFKGKVK